ncbi:MAG: RNA methyltransferase [candidate division Zixibacteria bacterium]|nr:RNA methyltransferase [candidate division Zixibacteria bacterium]
MPVTKTELKNLKSLLTKKGRRQQRLFLAEGVRLLEESLRHRFYPETVYCSLSRLSGREKKLVDSFEDKDVKIVTLSEKQLEYVSPTIAPQGLVGVFKIPEIKAAELFHVRHRKLLLCENISDPGNLGTLIRSAAAFTFEVVLLAGNTADPYNPKTVRSSAGAVFAVKILKVRLEQLLTLVEDEKIFMIGTGPTGRYELNNLTNRLLKDRFLLAVGSEAEGLSDEFMNRCDAVVRIDHETGVESLNAAVAGSIIMKQVYDLLYREKNA